MAIPSLGNKLSSLTVGFTVTAFIIGGAITCVRIDVIIADVDDACTSRLTWVIVTRIHCENKMMKNSRIRVWDIVLIPKKK